MSAITEHDLVELRKWAISRQDGRFPDVDAADRLVTYLIKGTKLGMHHSWHTEQEIVDALAKAGAVVVSGSRRVEPTIDFEGRKRVALLILEEASVLLKLSKEYAEVLLMWIQKMDQETYKWSPNIKV